MSWTDRHAQWILIAAEPDLLAACEGLLVLLGSYAGSGDYPPFDAPETVSAREAIAKGKG